MCVEGGPCAWRASACFDGATVLLGGRRTLPWKRTAGRSTACLTAHHLALVAQSNLLEAQTKLFEGTAIA